MAVDDDESTERLEEWLERVAWRLDEAGLAAIRQALAPVADPAGYVGALEELLPRLGDEVQGAAMELMIDAPGGVARTSRGPRSPAS